MLDTNNSNVHRCVLVWYNEIGENDAYELTFVLTPDTFIIIHQ